MALSRLCVSLISIVGLAGLWAGCGDDASGLSCITGTHEENGTCVSDYGDDTQQDTRIDKDTRIQAVPCEGILEGNYTLENQSDVDALAGYVEITGDLVVQHTALTSFYLPCLTSLGGDLAVYPNTDLWITPTLTSFDLSGLIQLGGNLQVQNNGILTDVDLSALTHVGGDLQVEDNASLATFHLPALAAVGGDLSAGNNGGLTALNLPGLTDVGGNLRLENNDGLTALSLLSLS